MESTQQLIPGILGGMGPEATIDFMIKVINQTNAKKDQDHIHLIVEHNPKIPNRHQSIRDCNQEVAAILVDMAQRLENAGADFIAMVCNTAHAFENSISQAIKVPFISIISEVINELNSLRITNNKIGIMAAEGCLQAKLYQNSLLKSGYHPIVWDGDHIEQFMKLIYEIKAGNKSKAISNQMRLLTDNLIKRGASLLVIGCTEIPLVLDEKTLTVPALNSTDILVRSVIDYSLGVKELPVYN